MKKLLFIVTCLSGMLSFGQTVFLETFTDANTTTSGTDDVGGVAWTANCPYCGATGDWNYVQTNVLENTDSNGPAYWETGEIDISACTDGVTISMDLSHTSTLENLAATCTGGCLQTDIVKLEVSYNGGASWSPYSDAINGTTNTGAIACDCGTCGSPDANYPVPWCTDTLYGPTITVGNFAAFSFSDCISVGISPTVKLRTTTMTWAAAEKIRIDNITLACSSCALPVEITEFNAIRNTNNVILSWQTLSEINNKKFNIERSRDGILFEKIGHVSGVENSSSTNDYTYIDKYPLNTSVSYYRLQQLDLNGDLKYSAVKSVTSSYTEIYYTGSEINVNFESLPNKNYTVNIYDISGKLIYTKNTTNGDLIPWSKSGFYILEIPELEIRQKLVIP